MIGTLIKISWQTLKRDYVALGLTFVLPIVFFSIFALIFGSAAKSSGGGSKAMPILVVDQDGTDVSRRFVEAIDEQSALRVVTAPQPSEQAPNPAPFTRETARRDVRSGRHDAAVIIPEGFGSSFGSFDADASPIEVIHDAANPMAAPTVSGLLQASAMMAAPDVLMEKGLAQLEQFGGALTPKQREAVDTFLPALRGEGPGVPPEGATPAEGSLEPASSGGPAFTGIVKVEMIEARSEDEAVEGQAKPRSMVAYYAAGVGVMFLLFSMAAAGGSLLEEEENGTLERVLSSNVDMRTLLLGKWLFFAVLGVFQVTLMFVWGAVVFDLDLFTAKHLAGFTAMTLVTAAAAAAFGIVLATLCRSRAQLSGMSTILILIMSALGGSMMPKFVAPDLFAMTSPFTINGWALDGYLKVFWHDDPQAGLVASVTTLWPQLLVLTLLTVAFLGLARLLARRWEAV